MLQTFAMWDLALRNRKTLFLRPPRCRRSHNYHFVSRALAFRSNTLALFNNNVQGCASACHLDKTMQTRRPQPPPCSSTVRLWAGEALQYYPQGPSWRWGGRPCLTARSNSLGGDGQVIEKSEGPRPPWPQEDQGQLLLWTWTRLLATAISRGRKHFQLMLPLLR